MKITKFDVLRYLTENEIKGKEELFKLIRKNIKYEDLSLRTLEEKLRGLRRENLIKDFQPNLENTKTFDYLAFVYWVRFRNINYEDLIKNNCREIFEETLKSNEINMEDLMLKTGLSRPTVSKYVDILTENNFVRKKSKKPILLEALINDCTLFYINLFEMDLSEIANSFRIPELDYEIPGIREKIAEMHSYSTTVTEGNTATPEDVHRVLGDFPTDLTPREIREIENSYKSLKKLNKMINEPITVEKIKELHEILMQDLVEKPGKFKYGRKKIVGSDFDLPTSRYEIDFSLQALTNFIEKYSNLRNEILGILAHFIFVSIHPFEDGNGRMGRLIHSWILMKEENAAFIYDPNKRGEYRDLLEGGNKKDLRDFIQFCLEEHKKSLVELREEDL